MSQRQQQLAQFLDNEYGNDDDDEMRLWITSQLVHDSMHVPDSDLEAYLKTIHVQRLGWNHPMFDAYRQQEKEHDDTMKKPMDVAEGVVQCLKCHSFKVYCVSVQTRSADEATTTLAHCTQCHAQWTQNH